MGTTVVRRGTVCVIAAHLVSWPRAYKAMPFEWYGATLEPTGSGSDDAMELVSGDEQYHWEEACRR